MDRTKILPMPELKLRPLLRPVRSQSLYRLCYWLLKMDKIYTTATATTTTTTATATATATTATTTTKVYILLR
jgi:hypothetical protein